MQRLPWGLSICYFYFRFIFKSRKDFLTEFVCGAQSSKNWIPSMKEHNPRSPVAWRWPFLITMFALLLFGANHAAQPPRQIQYGERPGAAKRTTLLLRDFQPKSMLHVAVHNIVRARFPVWDVHNHVDDAMRSENRIPPAQLVQSMDRVNVAKIVILTGGWGDALQRVLDNTAKRYPDRFIVFTQLDYSRVNDPRFGEEMVQQIDDAVRRGARGLKFLKDLGLGVRTSDGKLLRIDDARLDPAWKECGRLGIPVAIHTSDPEAFFTPVDRYNERYEELKAKPVVELL